MILQKITIVNLGAIEHFTRDFVDDVNLLKTGNTNEISYAVQVILNHKDIPPLPRTAVREDTQIEAILSIAKKKYNIIVQPDKVKRVFSLHAYDEQQRDVTTEYLYLTDHCAEQDSADVFVGTEREMPLRFLQYANEEVYFPQNELHRLTGKMSSLKTFRAYLKQFIKQFEPQVIREGKLYEFILKSDGRYGVRYKNDDGMPVCLSESEQILFRYLCFIKTLEFWRGFEELRNFHGLQKPILVENLLERIDQSIDVQNLIKRTAEFNRQMIILTI
jgi:hypothetical protein